MRIFLATILLLLFPFLFLGEQSLSETKAQTAVARWDSVCITKVDKDERTYVEAPLNRDGSPDMTHATAHGVLITLAHGCMQYKVQR